MVDSRTFKSTLIMAAISVMVSALLTAVPDLAKYESELFDILKLVMAAVALRFGVPGVVSEVLDSWNGDKE